MGPITILVVDDEPGIALLCKRLLSRAGYFVVALTDPKEAAAWVKEHAADLLLVDIRMPEVDGFELITLARQMQPDLAVLVMTGFGTVETAIRALRQGVDGLILKPFQNGEELVQAVKLAFSDNQKKRDAARINALRPLFTVTESLFSETRQDSLLDLIVNAVLGQLRCRHAAYYQYSQTDARFVLLSGIGKTLTDFLIQADAGGAPILINAVGPGSPDLQARLRKAGLGAVMFAPIVSPGSRSILFAGRDPEETPFSEADLEMFQILARQSAAAMENARLYDEQRTYVRKIEDSQTALLQAEKMAAAGRLSASIAHEVNNPLQSVQNCLHLAGRGDLPEAKRMEYFDLARMELERLSLTVRRMLDFYRPGAAKPEQVNIPEMLNYVLSLMQKQLAERGIETKINFPSSLPPVTAVNSQIQQVLINLILNAFDAMPAGGRLAITGRSVEGGVEVMFQDSGPGVPIEEQKNIFEPFFSTKEGGTGLGLTVSYNIVTAHGGSLDLLAGQGHGACFRLFLPTGDTR
ncbi:MAG TPA: response regulator [Anaerolineales bacterium]|nr:response regulator [Anaerolineales bacterium]